MKISKAVLVLFTLSGCDESGGDADLEALEMRIEALEEAVGQGGSDDMPDDSNVAERLTTLEAAVSTNSSAITTLQTSVSGLDTSVTSLSSSMTTVQSAITALETDVTEHETRIGDLEASSGGLTVMEQSVFSAVAPTDWTALDLSAHVGEEQALIMLRVDVPTDDIDGRVIFRVPGESDVFEVNSTGISSSRTRNEGVSYILAMTDSTGSVEWNSTFPGTNAVELTLVAVIR